MESKRINKYLSEVGFCSRRKADEYISLGRVYINGKVAELGSKVNMDDEIKVDGEIISEISGYPAFYTQIIFDTFDKTIKIKSVLNNTEGISILSNCEKIIKYKLES